MGKIGFERKGATAFYLKYRVVSVHLAVPVDLKTDPKV